MAPSKGFFGGNEKQERKSFLSYFKVKNWIRDTDKGHFRAKTKYFVFMTDIKNTEIALPFVLFGVKLETGGSIISAVYKRLFFLA